MKYCFLYARNFFGFKGEVDGLARFNSSSGLTLIGVIIAVVMLSLLGAGVFMLMSSGTIESAQKMNAGASFYAAESGVSAARYHMGSNPGWESNAPVIITGVVGQASFSAVIESNTTITSVGRSGDTQWTSVRTGAVAEAGGQIVLEYAGGDNTGKIADFPGQSGDCAQSFTTPNYGISAVKIELHLRRQGRSSPVYITLRSGSTVGPILVSSDTIQSIPERQATWVVFTLDVPVPLDPNTMYFIRMSSIPTSTDAKSKAKGTVRWVYCQSAFEPPGYSGGDAWRYIGRDNTPADQGECLVNYDFNFRIYN